MTAEEEADLIKAERSPAHETSFVVLSDVHLDNPKIMTALKSVFSVYEDTETKPSLFILCGNFRSRPFLFDGDSSREYNRTSLMFFSANILLT
jgi:DNA polymerase epsilon subunit 2